MPMRYPPNPVLGRWVVSVRQRKKRGELTNDIIRLLDALGFSWVRKPRGVHVPWEERINELKAFKKEHGHSNVPTTYQRNPSLAIWVYNVRQRKKHGQLAEDKILSLDALGLCWVRWEKRKLPKKPI